MKRSVWSAAAVALVVLAAVLAGLLAVTAPERPPPQPHRVAPPSGSTWRLDFSDDFTGTAVDPKRWTTCWDWTVEHCSDSATALDGLERHTPGQVRVGDGVAAFIAQRASKPRRGDCYQGRCTYRSGLLTTARPGRPDAPYLYTFRYGYAEARIAVSTDPGFWSTFWLLPRRSDLRTDYTHEIDVLEAAGDRAGLPLQTYHYAGRSQQFRPSGCRPLPSAGFHTYGVDWQPESISFFVDGHRCGRFADPRHIYDKPMQLILDLMVLPSTVRETGTTAADLAGSSRMVVDYVRVWRATSSVG